MYRVHLDSGANQGEIPGIGESPSNQPISGLVIFSKRQALSRAVVVSSNMSRGKYLAREGPGSRLLALARNAYEAVIVIVMATIAIMRPVHQQASKLNQALPALKVAIVGDCLGKGLAFTKNGPPDFGLLFLAQSTWF